VTAADGHHTSYQYHEDGSWVQRTAPAIHPGAVERRVFIIDSALTDIATDKTAVATGELRTYTFDEAMDYRYAELEFMLDATATSDVLCVAYTLNAPNVTAAASRLSVTETDTDAVGDYLYRGQAVTVGSTVAITRIDMTGIMGQGGVSLAEDMIVLRVW